MKSLRRTCNTIWIAGFLSMPSALCSLIMLSHRWMFLFVVVGPVGTVFAPASSQTEWSQIIFVCMTIYMLFLPALGTIVSKDQENA